MIFTKPWTGEKHVFRIFHIGRACRTKIVVIDTKSFLVSQKASMPAEKLSQAVIHLTVSSLQPLLDVGDKTLRPSSIRYHVPPILPSLSCYQLLFSPDTIAIRFAVFLQSLIDFGSFFSDQLDWWHSRYYTYGLVRHSAKCTNYS